MTMETLTQTWHTLSEQEAAAALKIDLEQGLSEDEVQRRQAKFGPNELKERARRTFLNAAPNDRFRSCQTSPTTAPRMITTPMAIR